MSAKTISLMFDGYWRETNISGVPKKAGIYVVYECSYNEWQNSVSLLKLVYIGKSDDDANNRIANHEKWSQWRRHCGATHEICFSFSEVTINSDRERAEAALIYQHKPPVNDQYVYDFPFEETTVRLTGKIALLSAYFTVEGKKTFSR